MNTYAEIRDDIVVKGDFSTTAAFITQDTLNNWIDQAHKWAAAYRKWPFTEGRVSTTFASLATNADGLLEGNYPEGWRPDSIRKMRIGGNRVEKKEFYKFLDFIEDFSSDTERIFSDFGQVYYVNPNIDISGTVAVWGQYTPATIDFTDENATTVFSNNAPNANEAIIEKVLSFVKKKQQRHNEAAVHEANAVNILNAQWQNIADEQYAYQSPDNDGMWKHIDVIEGVEREDLFDRDQFI